MNLAVSFSHGLKYCVQHVVADEMVMNDYELYKADVFTDDM